MATTTRQRLAGGVVIGVAAIAFYLGTQFKGPGLGGSGSGEGSPASGGAAGSSTTEGSELAGDEAVMAVSATPPPEVQSPRVAVVISGNEYLLSTAGNEKDAILSSLEEVIQAVQAATGDRDGIRIRIFRTKDATAGAKDDLLAKLAEASIPLKAIQDMKASPDE